MSFLALCGIVYLIGFVCSAIFLIGQECAYSGTPHPVDFFVCIARGVAFSIVICSPFLVFCAMAVVGGMRL
jgi:hypothetical protein